MSIRFTREQIQTELRNEVADCLALEPEEITEGSGFFDELGGESIDMLDLSFRCERRFGVRPGLERLLSEQEWQLIDGSLDADSLNRLASDFPQIDWRQHLSNRRLNTPRDAVTVGLIGDLVYFNLTAPATTNP